ncbi:ABC transporter ATP-binding protein [Allopusillimonas soli]|uniref:ABC transporter ATP-binding protein n=1 Tax=Allopusillimonas soli TaxID=659016 RepID=A0A853F627_9BURK|nr:ABC transporter ATP-binding protein [Allopusillimonas soli]NYT36004.1 ABC transporter ATP-binding protein [Allopusillimonas soli]TEA76348.1 ABC transporter ATP-binding protein [Allopusillimonas soli]
MLQLDDMTIRFGALTAVDAVTLTAHRNEVLGLVGPNGAGKTTLFNAISGLVRPTSGSIRFQDADLSRMPLHRRARLGIGRTFQIPQPLAELTVRENLVVAQRFSTGRTDDEQIAQVLDFTGLAALAQRNAATELALTELKALEIAKALCTKPKLLLLDEVLAGLETAGKRRFVGMLRDLHARFQVGIVIIEHDIETIGQLCNRVAALDFGHLIALGTPDDVFNDPEVVRSYTGGQT